MRRVMASYSRCCVVHALYPVVIVAYNSKVEAKSDQSYKNHALEWQIVCPCVSEECHKRDC